MQKADILDFEDLGCQKKKKKKKQLPAMFLIILPFWPKVVFLPPTHKDFVPEAAFCFLLSACVFYCLICSFNYCDMCSIIVLFL